MNGMISEYISVSEVKVVQSCPTLCDPMDYTVCGILQARILEWVAFPFSSGSSRPRNRTGVFCTAGRFFTSWATRKSKRKRKTSIDAIFLFLNISNKEEGRKLGSRENNLKMDFMEWPNWKHLIQLGIIPFDLIRDHVLQSPTFADKETKTRRMKMCLFKSRTWVTSNT